MAHAFKVGDFVAPNIGYSPKGCFLPASGGNIEIDKETAYKIVHTFKDFVWISVRGKIQGAFKQEQFRAAKPIEIVRGRAQLIKS